MQKHTGAADNYWLENDGTTAGPRLTAALAAIAGAGVGYGSLVYSHGEQDAAFTTTAALANEVRAGVEAIRQAARTQANPGNTNGVSWFVDMLGPRYAIHGMNEYRLRDAMLDMIEAGMDAERKLVRAGKGDSLAGLILVRHQQRRLHHQGVVSGEGLASVSRHPHRGHIGVMGQQFRVAVVVKVQMRPDQGSWQGHGSTQNKHVII
nr:hypothetical protein [Pseudogemmobacter hezensis]